MKTAYTRTAALGGILMVLLCAGCRAGPASNGRMEPETAGLEETDIQRGTVREEITLMHADAGKEEFEAYIRRAEEALDLSIHVVPCPINADSRHARISTILASGDASVDIISVNDEMISEFKSAGYLEPLQYDIMTPEVRKHYPQEYVDQMLMWGENIYSVPYMMDVMMLWVNEAYLEEMGETKLATRADLERFLAYDWGPGRYAYGGAWEKTYVYNEIGAFISLFGGDYYDWENPATREAIRFLHDMAQNGQTADSQLLDQYEQLNQKFIDGKYGLIFAYSGSMNSFVDAGVYREDKLHPMELPDIAGEKTAYVATWQYVLNKASGNKEAAKKFLEYAAGREGSIDYAVSMNRLPAREDLVHSEELEIAGYAQLKAYLSTVSLEARPMPENSMEYISRMGTLFQRYITGDLDLEEYCLLAQELVDTIKEMKIY